MAEPSFEQLVADYSSWAPILGEWELEDHSARFVPNDDQRVGLLLGPHYFEGGAFQVAVTFDEGAESDPQGRVIFGYDSESQAHYSVGLGGYQRAYVVDEHMPGTGFIPIRGEGTAGHLDRDVPHELRGTLLGQVVTLRVDDVEVMRVRLPHPLPGEQLGLTAWGSVPVEFGPLSILREAPQAFVVMQFGEPYDALYNEVIRPVAEDEGYHVIRADDVYGPGIILEDITQGIREATVVVAEITPANRNVFYELGYSHAMGKPTILLAARGESLPFDVSGYRCIFYDDTIGGKRTVEDQLRRHLRAI